MNHIGTITLETTRLILRRIELKDSKAMFDNWASDPDVAKYLSWAPHKDEDETKEIIIKWLKEYENKNFYQWVITLKDDINNPLGTISVAEMDDKTGVASIGYCIGKNYWHQGITSEALKRVMEFLFNEIKVNKVEARHDTRNPNSGLVMKKCGMKYEGTLRARYTGNSGICDCSFYGILKSEY